MWSGTVVPRWVLHTCLGDLAIMSGWVAGIIMAPAPQWWQSAGRGSSSSSVVNTKQRCLWVLTAEGSQQVQQSLLVVYSHPWQLSAGCLVVLGTWGLRTLLSARSRWLASSRVACCLWSSHRWPLAPHLWPPFFSCWDGHVDITEMCGLRSWLLLGATEGAVVLVPSLSMFVCLLEVQ